MYENTFNVVRNEIRYFSIKYKVLIKTHKISPSKKFRFKFTNVIFEIIVMTSFAVIHVGVE